MCLYLFIEPFMAAALIALLYSNTYVHMQDLESALQYILRHEIATCHSIADEKLAALKLFIAVLATVKAVLLSVDSEN